MNSKIYIIHYSKLSERKFYLESKLNKESIKYEYITENSFLDFEIQKNRRFSVCGIPNFIEGWANAVNDQLTRHSRRKAIIISLLLMVLRLFSSKYSLKKRYYTTRNPLISSALEVQRMHLTALFHGIHDGSKWIFILEDDAVPSKFAFSECSKIIDAFYSNNSWINLNSGAGLRRTSSDSTPNEFNLYKVWPPSTRASVAYLISREFALKVIDDALKNGVPNWLQIDSFYRVMALKYRIKTYWHEPGLFTEGSSSGKYKNNFPNERRVISSD